MAYVSRGVIPVSNVVTNTGRTELYYVPTSEANNIALYDVVKANTTSDSTGVPGLARISGINDVPCGVVVGFVADPDYLNQTYRTASTGRYALVLTDPNAEFSVQEDNTGGSKLAAARIGTPVDVAIAAVDTATGTSSMQIGSGSLSGSPGMFRLERRDTAINNAAMGGTNTRWIVTFNVHQKKATS